MKLSKTPDIHRYWVINNTSLQLSCAYKSRDKRDFSWTYQHLYIGKFGFDITLEDRSVGGAVELTSSVTKSRVDMKDEGEYKCQIGGMERTWDVRILSRELHLL